VIVSETHIIISEKLFYLSSLNSDFTLHMKKIYLLLSCILFGISALFAQNPIDYSIRVSAIIQKSPAQILLHWPKDLNVANYFIYKRLKGGASFGSPIATLINTDTSYTDNNVTVGVNYEYQLVKTITKIAYYGFGYISAGIEVPVTENRGKLILLFDKNFLPTLKPEIDRMILDLSGDGWIVLTHSVDTTDSVTKVHRLIESDYNNDKANVKAVFLLGHIPVPYSGGSGSFGLNPPDGHPQHKGAWPADIYYGVLNANWTDNDVVQLSGTYGANQNRIDDGKFDQDVIPASASIAVGRVDMFKMPAFAPLTEIDLIRRYLDKDHRWRTGGVSMPERALIKDNFGIVPENKTSHLFDEVFSSSSYSGFSAMFGSQNVIDTGNWENDLTKTGFLWAYGCGGGDFVSAGGISQTSNFAKDSLKTVFMMLFGSYFGDWNVTNNYLRAPLASKGPILTDCWSGRPEWNFHHLALGETFAYSTLINYNQYANGAADYTNYFRSCIFGSGDRMIHVALMGDPSLRMHVVQPPGKLTLSNNKLVVTLNWQASTDKDLIGYYIYRSAGLDQPFTRISSNLVSGTTFTDNSALHHKNFYMVRAVKLQTSASGSYFNMSQGSIDTLTTDNSGILPETLVQNINIYPNPGQNVFHIVWAGTQQNEGIIKVYDMLGNEILSRNVTGLDRLQTIDLDLNAAAKGVYFVRITNGNQEYMQKIVKE
jgi:hypothetical protein